MVRRALNIVAIIAEFSIPVLWIMIGIALIIGGATGWLM